MAYFGHGSGRDGLTPIPRLRIRQMEDSATLTPSAAGQITISSACGSGFLEFKELVPTSTGSRALEYMEPFEFEKRTEMDVGGAARFYTIKGDTLYLGPYSDATIAARWYEKFTALSADGDTDWVLTNASQVYLDGCRMLAASYGMEADVAAMMRASFAAGINALNMNSTAAKMSGAPRRAIPRVVV